MDNLLIENIDKVHTTDMGVDRIRRNLGLGEIDVVNWCKEEILIFEIFYFHENLHKADNLCVIPKTNIMIFILFISENLVKDLL